MSANGWLQIGVFLVVLTAVTPLIGAYMARVYSGKRLLLERFFGPLERATYRALSVDPQREQNWKRYARSVLAFSALSWFALYLILRTQSLHPLNPEGFGPIPWDVSFNTVTSFITNTNWQFYGGETALSYFSQMVGLTVQNFVSAAVGMGALVALIRGITRKETDALGNFWQDLVRGVLYILLPLSVLGALVLVSQGAIQSLTSYAHITTLVGGEQTLPFGPVASQEAVKMLGTNGGGFFNVNSAMPFENPTAISNFLQVLMILLIPAGLTATFGRMVGSRRQGWSVFTAMMVMFTISVSVLYVAESNSSPAQQQAGVAGANLEGKEQRFGTAGSALFIAATTAASNGAVNTSIDSLTALGGAIPMANIMTGEVVFGGVGSGLYGMLLFVLLAVFLAGLMVGRTPEYLGKKIEAREIKLVVIATLFVPAAVLVLTALAIGTKYGMPSIFNAGPQGFSETLYAYLSQANNNGSAMAGYTGFVQPNAPGNVGSFGITFADLLGGVAMLFGRFVPIVAMLAIAGSLAGKRIAPIGVGTMRTDTPTFVVLLISAVVLLALLTFIPALLLGPVVQALSDQLF